MPAEQLNNPLSTGYGQQEDNITSFEQYGNDLDNEHYVRM